MRWREVFGFAGCVRMVCGRMGREDGKEEGGVFEGSAGGGDVYRGVRQKQKQRYISCIVACDERRNRAPAAA